MLQFTLNSEIDALGFGNQLAKIVEPGTVIYLNGTLGAGKTTITRGFLQGLGFNGKVKSPTYTLVEPYDINGMPIYHFDFYRLQDANELENIGVRDYFSGNGICIIEWPDKAFPLLPPADITCDISFANTSRVITLQAHSKKGEATLKRFK